MKKMKHLKYFEDFGKKEYAVDDVVKLKSGDAAKIKKVYTPNSYIVNINKNDRYLPKPIEVSGNEIVGMIDSNSKPATGSDIFKKSQNDPSNDFVINGGYPDTPLANVMDY